MRLNSPACLFFFGELDAAHSSFSVEAIFKPRVEDEEDEDEEDEEEGCCSVKMAPPLLMFAV